MKNYRGITPIVLIIMMALSFYTMLSSYTKENAQYNEYLSLARGYSEDGIMVDALFMYNNALKMKDTLALRLEVGDMLVKLEELDEAIAWGEVMVDKYDKESAAYEFLLNCYIADGDYGKCFSLNDKVCSRKLETEKFVETMRAIEYQYTVGFEGYENVGMFSSGYCPVYKEEKWGYIDLKGSTVIMRQYQAASVFTICDTDEKGESLICAPVVEAEGAMYYIDKNGDKKYIIRNLDNCTYIGPVIENVLVAANGEKYAYYDLDFNKLSQEYDFASTMNGGYGVVKVGEQWNIINSEYALGKESFENFIFDEKGMAFRADRAFGMQGGKYYLVDPQGKHVSDEAFEDAKPFLSTGYAAVKQKGLWGFVDIDGKLVIPCQYEDAHSFTMDMAAVKQNGLWGYIDTEGNVLIDYIFQDAKCVNDAGNAFVNDGNAWNLMKLFKYNY